LQKKASGSEKKSRIPLFEESPKIQEEPDGQESFTSIVIHSNPQKLSPLQKKYRLALKKITVLETQIIEHKKILDGYLEKWLKEAFPIEKKISTTQKKIAGLIDRETEGMKFGKNQKMLLSDFMLNLLNEAFAIEEPTEKEYALYKKYDSADPDFPDGMDESLGDEVIMELQKELLEETGVWIDIEIFKKGPEAVREAIAELEGKTEKERNKKGTEKQRQKAAKEKKRGQVQLKSVRNLYLSLAKVLHPDTEMDNQLRLEKENLMKQVSTAYKANDLLALLSIEHQWLDRDDSHLENLSEDTLQTYIQIFQQQARDLRNQLQMVIFEPAYVRLQKFLTYGIEGLPRRYEDWLFHIKKIKPSVNALYKHLNQGFTKQSLLELIDRIGY
jgi:hypothetical protein